MNTYFPITLERLGKEKNSIAMLINKRYLTVFIIFLILPQLSSAQDQLLGEISFPNSGAEEAKEDFIKGVLFLHNFEYEDAARAFRRAQEKDPGFAMAYWGEAMTYNHPIWMQQDREAAMEVLNRLGETVEERQSKAPTEREKDYLMAIEVLYGNIPESEGRTKEERDLLYRDKMEELHEKYPDDNEITTFYGLSILGTAHEGRDYGTYMKAAAELLDVWNENKKHPGAAHYLIHSFDDPDHAPLGLPMAKAYAEIAPAAAHAQHMTSHIFLALGMWEDVIDANIVARDVQTSRQKELGERPTVCGHYTWWLQYGYLQNGGPQQAADVLNRCSERVEAGTNASERWHFAIMRAHQIVDTQNWQQAQNWTADFESGERGSFHFFFTSALAAIKTNRPEEARRNLNKMKEISEGPEQNIQVKQIQSLLLMEEGKTDEGRALLEEAVAEEAELPVAFGPPIIVKPSRELLGDVLMELGSYQEATEAYEKQLERTPERRRSLIGKEKAMGMAER